MKQYSKKLFSLVVLCSATTVLLQADNNGNRVVPFLQWRSQGRDTARKLYGTTSYAVYQDDMDSVYGTFNATVQYDQSFRGYELAEALFGNSLTAATGSDCDDRNTLTISGELTAAGAPSTTRGTYDWMAENFYLPRDFSSTITFSPKVKDVVVDFDLYVGLDRWVKGLYFRLYGPVAWNKASLNADETLGTTAVVGYEQGFFDPLVPVPATALFQSALSFFGGCQLPAYTGKDAALTIQPLKFAKFSGCNLPSSNSCDSGCGFSQHKTGFAELRGEFGWNYIQEKYRLGINVQAAAPTGTKVEAEFLFPAQVGNGKHWELGVGLMGAWRMWGSEDGEKSFNFIVEADVTHLFHAKQERTFDLKGKPNSRYMLAEQLVLTSSITPAADQLAAASASVYQVDASTAGKPSYSPVANFSTQDCKVSIGAQGDVVAMFNYTVRGFSWDLGYNFWGMSSSKIELSNDQDSCGVATFPANTWALKGDASPYGYATGSTTVFVGLGATESHATIFSGTNALVTGATITTTLANTGIDAVVTPAVGSPAVALFAAGTATPAINTSVPAVLISVNDLDLEGAEQRGISNKVFTHFSYTWTNRDKWVPYIGAGFSAEFGSHSSNDVCPTTTTTTTNCPSSVSCALSKWAVEVKGGVSFH